MLAQYLPAIEARLKEIVPDIAQPPLFSAMRYSLLAGGKRLRAAMLLAGVEMLGGGWRGAMEYACALEMIHAYSLIHDDLPAMDDDTLRRGKPTNHVVYGEGQAILAGDGLLNCAYERMLADALAHEGRELSRRVAAIAEIARGAGVEFMVLGQSLDLQAEREGLSGEELLGRIHRGKTCGMFIGAMRAAGRLAGADDAAMAALEGFARAFGMMFQYEDDLLDVTGTALELGKSVGKDARGGKLTATAVYGTGGAERRAEAFEREARGYLAHFGAEAAPFEQLLSDMRGRRK